MDKQRRSTEPDSCQSAQESGEHRSGNFSSVDTEYTAGSTKYAESTENGYIETVSARADTDYLDAFSAGYTEHSGPPTAAEDLAEYVLRALVASDESLKITRESLAPSHIKIVAGCDQSGTGRLIGRGGKTINALRTVVRAIAQLHNKRVDIEIST
jgi:uncharacterized protein